jgi:ATP-dependent helicase/nuclease subunit A
VLGDDLEVAAVPVTPRSREREEGESPHWGLDAALLPKLNRPHPTGSRGSAFATAATRRGERIHLLLQHLAPPEPITDRLWLRELLDVDQREFESLWSDAHAILSAPDLRRFFDPARYLSARNEVAYVDATGEVRRIDRVVEFPHEIWLLDYKTGDRTAPGGVPQGMARYRAQLDVYRKAMESLSAGKPVLAAVIFPGGHLEPV